MIRQRPVATKIAAAFLTALTALTVMAGTVPLGSVQAALIGDEYLDAAGLDMVRSRGEPPQLARVSLARGQQDLPVYATPDSTPDSGEVVTRLPADAQVRVQSERRSASGQAWYGIRLWNAVDGYVKAESLAFSPPPAPAGGSGGGAAPWKPAQPPAQGPFSISFSATSAATEYAAEPDGPAAGKLVAGQQMAVTAWATDAQGRAWYAFASGAAAGWTLAETTKAQGPDPLTAMADGRPLAQIVAGKGMWFTYDTLRQTPPQYLIAAAKANGLSFLAPEAGTSRRGYWAGRELDALLPAAHAAGLKVIPWVYPWLTDLPGDVDLAVRAAGHVAPSGDTVDGVGIDIEENLEQGPIRAFGQLLRASVGPQMLLVAITYQPQIASGQHTPFATLVESFNVIAPMSYWHARNVRYTYQDAYDYVAESVRLIRERVGRQDVPIAILGQTFDWFSRNGIGLGNPSGEEIGGAIQAGRDLGILGTGFFNWFSTTPEEWDAIGG